MEFLNSCSPDNQPPLYLPLTPDMVGNDADGEAGLVNGLSQHESDGLSQVCTTEILTLLHSIYFLFHI